MAEIPQYSLDVLIYEGAEIALYRGRRSTDGLPVAVKLVRGQYPTWRELSRLRREYGILEGLDLQGVPRVIELTSHEGKLALVMEDLGPTNLADVIAARGRLDPRSALLLAIPLVRTLAELHDCHIVHKDVKPRNILVDVATWTPHLVDFGIAARISEQADDVAATGILEGTPAYIAPEQTGQVNRPVNRRADLYSMGATLYEMLTGAPPFDVAGLREAIHAHLTRAPVPLHERIPTIPVALSQIVLKLLSKAPENRYQSARGLLADLETLLAQCDTGKFLAFPIGSRDTLEEIALPDRLVGRESELQCLENALKGAREGNAVLALVEGPSGIGKSALVREVLTHAALGGATLAFGKFDLITRAEPYAAPVQAIQSLVRQTLAEPANTIAAKKLAIEAALGSAAKLFVDLCPDLEFLIGPQPEPPALAPSEAKNRFALLVRRFLSAFASNTAPLVLFFDDLQWADSASLELVTRLLGDSEMRHVLVVGTYRGEEIDAAHPLTAMRTALQVVVVEPNSPAIDGSLANVEVVVGPLSPDATALFVATALASNAPSVADLSQIAWEKTQGNPFFLGQFLHALADEQLLRFDPATRAFIWDIDRVRGASATENVATLLARKIDRLPDATRRALTMGAWFGPTFDLAKLSALLEAPPGRVATQLWDAVREGFIVPVGSDYRLLDEQTLLQNAKYDVSYRFAHDRIRESCLGLLPVDERPALHVAIGRLLLARAGNDISDDDLIEITRHMNDGALCIENADERLLVARLDLRAGRKSMAATAHVAAAALFAAARALVGDDGFANHYDLCFALWLEGAEADALAGEQERAESLMRTLLVKAKTPLDRANVHVLRIRIFAAQSKFADAVQAGFEGLATLSAALPDSPAEQQAAFVAALGKLQLLLQKHPIDSLADAPLLTDPVERTILTLLNEMCVPVYFVNPGLYGLVNLEQICRSLEHGLSEMGTFAFMAFGFMQGAIMGQPAEGLAFGRLALALADRFRSPQLIARVTMMFSNVLYVREPLRNALPHVLRGREASIEAGDNVYLSSSCYGLLPLLVGAGIPIEEIRAESERCLVHVVHAKDAMGTTAVKVSRQLLACLAGETDGPTSFDGPGIEMAAEIARVDASQHAIILYYLEAYRLLVHVIHNEYETALAVAPEAERRGMAVMGLYWTTYVPFLAALAHAGRARTADADARATHIAAISAARTRLLPLAESCPVNFRHKVLLLDAELATLGGAPWDAMPLYDQAIQGARDSGFMHEEAIANERAGDVLVAEGRERAARSYFMDAYQGFVAWGAKAKAQALLDRLPGSAIDMLRKTRAKTITSTGTSISQHTASRTLLTATSVGSLRDAVLIVRASQAIASEFVLSGIINRFMQTVLENAGAERGHLLLARDGSLYVEASFGASSDTVEVGRRRLLQDEPEIAQQTVLYAWRTAVPLVLDDAPTDFRFATEPYVVRAKPRSILCLPVIHQGRPVGILYLDNASLTHTFTNARIELLGLLASQAAISIENATLLERVQEAKEAVQRANEQLEQEVAARTVELEQSNIELSTANERLATELDDRAKAEAERSALRDQVLDAQKARLVELLAPILPVSEDVLVMPIIGTMDDARVAQVIDAALTATVKIGARVFILDITGMRHVDATAVTGLVSVAHALRLVGAVPILTGVRPDVARTMVEIAADITGLITLSTLRAGISHAFRRSGEMSPGRSSQTKPRG